MAEEWKKAKGSMPDVMRLMYTDPPIGFHQEGTDRWPQNAVVAVIGPFDNHMGQPELQSRLLDVLRQWNGEAAIRSLSPTPNQEKPE